MKRLNINVDDDLYNKFKIECINNGTNMTEAITEYMKETIDIEATIYKESKIKLEFIKSILEWIFDKKGENGFYDFMIGVKQGIEETIKEYESTK